MTIKIPEKWSLSKILLIFPSMSNDMKQSYKLDNK